MRHVKMWMWEGDPIAEAAFKALGVHPIPLSITDVLTSLQTRLIDGVYTPPLAAIALQWFTRVKFMLDAPLADAAGAVVISRKKFDELPPDLQEILVRNGRLFMEKLTKMSREDNAKAIQTLKKNGITVVEPPASALPTYDQIGKEGRRFLVPKLFPQEFLDKVEKSLAEYRSRNHPK
jgi:TRAP-type C4-dicarboxylate transport system substrate-binding protein